MTRPRILFLAFLAAGLAPTIALAGGGPNFGILQPVQTLLDWISGDIAKVLGALALAGVGFTWWRSRDDDEKGAKVAKWAVGLGIIVGAQPIVNALGFAGATF